MPHDGPGDEVVTVYTPDSVLRNPAALIRAMFRDVWLGRELAWRLAVRDTSAQYRQTALGLLWAFVMPLANTVVWVFLGASGIVATNQVGMSYPVYVFAGTMMWAIFSEAAAAPLRQVTNATPMLTRINFPREALIVAAIYKGLFNAAIKIAILVPALLLLGIAPGWGLLLVPLAVLALIVSGTVLGLLITPVGVLYQDVDRALPLLLPFLMYTAPVVFAVPQDGIAATVINHNPLTPLIVTARDWVTGMPAEHAGAFLLVFAASVCSLFVAWVIYRVAMPILIERMSA